MLRSGGAVYRHTDSRGDIPILETSTQHPFPHLIEYLTLYNEKLNLPSGFEVLMVVAIMSRVS
jgi:hypothetical protein